MESEETTAQGIKNKLKWFGHLCSMNDIHIPKMLYEYEWLLEGGR